jgi:tetratricopeptide (TPR) repeat protein
MKIIYLTLMMAGVSASAVMAENEVTLGHYKQSSLKLRENAILLRLSRAAVTRRQDIRLVLGKEYIATYRYADALDVLGVVSKYPLTDGQKLNFFVLRGSAELGLRHMAEASRDLDLASLDGRPDVWLKRVRMRHAEGNSKSAIVALSKSVDSYKKITKAELATTFVAAAKSLLNLNQAQYAHNFLSYAEKLTQNEFEKDEITLLRGDVAAQQNKTRDAGKFYALAQLRENRLVSTQATYNITLAELSAQKISPAKAISVLKRSRLSWKGDKLELAIIEKIGDLYAEQGKARDALANWRLATNYFPVDSDTRRIAEKEKALFSNYFLTSKNTIENFALFSDFRNLTPLGSAGDGLIRGLVNSLLDSGLSKRAAGILDYQVRYRLTGAAQSSVALQLAALHAQNGDSSLAIDVLNRTASIEVIPEISNQRRLVLARALIDQGDLLKAQSLLVGDRSVYAQELNADLYWREKNWKRLSDTLPTELRKVHSRKSILRQAYAANMMDDKKQMQFLKEKFSLDGMSSGEKEVFNQLASGVTLTPDVIKKMAPILTQMDELTSLDSFIRITL